MTSILSVSTAIWEWVPPACGTICFGLRPCCSAVVVRALSVCGTQVHLLGQDRLEPQAALVYTPLHSASWESYAMLMFLALSHCPCLAGDMKEGLLGEETGHNILWSRAVGFTLNLGTSAIKVKIQEWPLLLRPSPPPPHSGRLQWGHDPSWLMGE